MPVEGILLIDLPNDNNIVPRENFPKMMRPSHHNGFSLLPTDPPPPTPPRTTPPRPPAFPPVNNGMMTFGAPVSGQPPQYHSVPDDGSRRQAPQYQEIPYGTNGVIAHTELPAPTRQTSLSQQSDTEVDQALQYGGPPRSTSTAPLTELPPPPPGERRPRKKANPLYDGFNNEVVTTTSSSTKKPPAPTKDSCGRRSFRCIKHPVTICLIILVVVVNFVALLLLFTGTVEQVSPGSRQKLRQTTPVPGMTLPNQAEMLNIIRAQGETIARLEARIISLESLLLTNTTENATTTAKIAQNSVQIDQLAIQVSALTVNTSTQIDDLKTSLAATDIKANTNIQITSDLQATVEKLRANTTRIANDLNTLTARSETSTRDITRISDKNIAQDQEITQLQSRISMVQQEFEFDLTEYNHSIYEDIAEIRKMQGPPGVNGSRGADGVSNLAGCQYGMVSETSSFSRGTPTSVPPITATLGFTVTGVTCSTYEGTSANLMDDGNGGLFCQCDGEVSGSGAVRYCYQHYWECPTQ